MDRPVVVNSLLCFVQNYRDHPKLRLMVDDYFSKSAIAHARHLVAEISGNDEGDLFALFDQLGDDGLPVPSFVADDLSALPMALVGDEEGIAKDELLRELRLLKRFIQDALNGKPEETSPNAPNHVERRSRSPAVTPTVNGNCNNKMNTSASSPEFPVVPPSAAPSSPKSTASNTQSPAPPPTKKRAFNGKSLDDAVRKLTDKQRVGSAEPRWENGVSPPSTPTPTNQPQQNNSNSWQSTVDAQQAYLSIMRMMTPQTSSIFPSVVTPPSFGPMGGVVEKLEEEEKAEEGDDDDEKHFDDSSPSPSDDIKDDFDAASNDLEKPFVCQHANCCKRFANKFLLKKHMFIHTGLRPHTCPFCSKRFNRKDNLLRHKKTHTQGMEDLARRHQMALFGAAGAIDLAQSLGLDNENDDDE